MNPAATPPADRLPRSGRGWPMLVIGLLVGQLAVCGLIATIAASDRSAAIEPDYYRKALAWDDEARQRVRNTELGWRATLSVERTDRAAAAHRIVLSLSDRWGTALTGARISLVSFHRARSDRRTEVKLAEIGDGRYEAEFPFDRLGLWEFRASVVRDGDTFTFDTVEWLTQGAESSP